MWSFLQVVAYNLTWRRASCIPNLHVGFDIPTFSLRVIALRDIKAGEQFFNCYFQPDRSVKERQRQLAPYRFVCQCKACVNATPESDKLREEIDEKLRAIINGKEAMFAKPGSAFVRLILYSSWRRTSSRKGWTLGGGSSTCSTYSSKHMASLAIGRRRWNISTK
jgi:hypothetical protein